jgi:hypothetical protein
MLDKGWGRRLGNIGHGRGAGVYVHIFPGRRFLC